MQILNSLVKTSRSVALLVIRRMWILFPTPRIRWDHRKMGIRPRYAWVRLAHVVGQKSSIFGQLTDTCEEDKVGRELARRERDHCRRSSPPTSRLEKSAEENIYLFFFFFTIFYLFLFLPPIKDMKKQCTCRFHCFLPDNNNAGWPAADHFLSLEQNESSLWSSKKLSPTQPH